MALQAIPVIFIPKFDLIYKPEVSEYLYDNNLQISFSSHFSSYLI